VELVGLTNFFVRLEARLDVLELRYTSSAFNAIPTPIRNERARALGNMLRGLDDLKILHLQGLVIDNELIHAMTVPVQDADIRNHAGSTICPELHALRLSCGEHEAVDVRLDAVEDMVESRWRSSRTLRSVGLRFQDVGDIKEESERLRAYINEGLVFDEIY